MVDNFGGLSYGLEASFMDNTEMGASHRHAYHSELVLHFSCVKDALTLR